MPRKIEIIEMPEALSASEATENVNNVQKRTWRRWNQQARYVFNTVFNQMRDQRVVKHPAAFYVTDNQWQTIRWNAAWLAADAAMESVTGKI